MTVQQYCRQLSGKIASIRQEIAQAKEGRICLGTNEGTFGSDECQRKVGTGDPKYGNYTLWETIGGTKITEGCDPEKAPGYTRWNKEAKAELARQRAEIKAREKAAAKQIAEINQEIEETTSLGMLTTAQAAAY